ncbi:RNA-binding S4 domain-containing protein [Thioalkalivibrio paradoxus]|uniref:Heat shock protein 15 n=1 Tax=Thioalkalivibrio paradoxus ARh 1 TaxID=713585 RepID=W0DPF6_9GAMM|nr:S4 domain-containing protein [Thioalkalivibrio paradoxus]AHE99132.1 ribosome-associated heat shock protein Hsp15 [Thioalkalivibrio paradoxus ARh 1]
METGPERASLRIDKWLWAARFFKTRALATEAVAGGKVHVNGDRCKPGRKLHPGDRLTIHRGQEVFDIEVVGINSQRRPASEARTLYQETPESIARREAEAERRRQERLDRGPGRRPDKRERRHIRRFIRKEGE